MGNIIKNKSYEELEFTDDFLFCKILQNDPDLCKELTELIIGRKIGKIVTINNQKPVELTIDGRGVRFDVYMEDDEFTVYDIEMQTYKEADLPKRTRYYQGMIDLNMMGRGEKFRELKRSYLVFICLRNPFKDAGYHKYEFCNMCRQDTSIQLGDEAYKIVLSAEGNKDDVSGDMKEFLRYLTTRQTDSDLTRKLDERVKEARAQKKWRLEYMTLLERDEQKREEGRAEGRAEGEKIFGELVKKLMADGLLEEIEKVTGDMEYRHSLYEKYGLK